jgi:hypothetical protein
MDKDLLNTMMDGFNESLRLVGQSILINGIEVFGTVNDNTGTVKLVKGGFEQQEVTEIVIHRDCYESSVLLVPKAQVTIEVGNVKYLLDGVRSNLATPFVTLECVRHRK